LLNVVLFFLKIEKIKMAPRFFQKSFSIMKMVNARHMSSRSKIYELRTYSIKPECMKPFLELTFENFHLRTEVSKLHGYWTAELGGLNQVVHIWEYENYGHRTEVRKSLASNQDWIDQYFGKILPMMSGQTNVGLISMNRPGKPDLIHPEGQGVYELWSMPSNNLVYRGTKKIISTMEDVENKSSTLCGSFKTMFGNIGTTYHLWRHENFDEAQALRTMWISNQANAEMDGVNGLEVKGLQPIKISPLQ